MSIQTQELRAVIWPLLNPDTGLMYCDRFSWQELEARAGEYTFEGITKTIKRADSIKRFALVHIEPDVPEWSLTPVADFVRLIGNLAKAVGKERAVFGVDVSCPGAEAERTEGELKAIAEAFREGFPYAIQFVRVGSAFESFVVRGGHAGLIITPQNMNEYTEKWPDMPLRMQVDPTKPEEVQQAIDNHISILEVHDLSMANAATHAGHRFQARRVELDEHLKESHQVGVTVTLANVGSLPCYADACFHLRLCGTDVDCERVYPLPLKAADVRPGDVCPVFVQMDTEGMPSGEYEIQIGLFCEGTDYPISFGIEGRISDGYYEGRLILRL